MVEISRGQRLKLTDIIPNGQTCGIGLAIQAPGLTLDYSCFGIDAAGKLSDERYLTFYNQPASPCGGVVLAAPAGDQGGFTLNLQKLPATIDRLVFTVAIDGAGTMGQITEGYLRFLENSREVARFIFRGKDFADENAVMIGEIYRKDNAWRFSAIGQGFKGGLDALVRHFGGVVAEPPAVAPAPTGPAPANTARINLEKRIEKEAPQLVSLVKKAKLSLEKAGLGEHRAKVALCLDISGSMHSLYRSGKIQAFSERILALGCRFDDDGEIDVFLFGAQAHHPAPMTLSNCHDYIAQLVRDYPLEGDTRYGLAMECIRRFYFPDAHGKERHSSTSAAVPVYVMFVTDGGTSDKPYTERQLRWASREPIFWQFMGIGKGRKSKSKLLAAFSDSDFPFLEKLDALSGRFLDNANFFSVLSPEEHSDDVLYDLLMAEYPKWVQEAKAKELIR